MIEVVRAPRPDGGRSVLLLHGFGVPARTVAPLAAWFASAGWDARTAPLGWNVGCGEATVDLVLDLLERWTESSGHPVAIVGHSRGGLIGRVAAVRRPEVVAGLVTVCTPWAVGPPDRPGVGTMAELIRFARRHGLRTMASIDCDRGSCCTTFREDMIRVPAVPWTALWSSTDSIGGAAASPPAGPDATRDLCTSHLGAIGSDVGRAALGDALRAMGLTAEP